METRQTPGIKFIASMKTPKMASVDNDYGDQQKKYAVDSTYENNFFKNSNKSENPTF